VLAAHPAEDHPTGSHAHAAPAGHRQHASVTAMPVLVGQDIPTWQQLPLHTLPRTKCSASARRSLSCAVSDSCQVRAVTNCSSCFLVTAPCCCCFCCCCSCTSLSCFNSSICRRNSATRSYNTAVEGDTAQDTTRLGDTRHCPTIAGLGPARATPCLGLQSGKLPSSSIAHGMMSETLIIAMILSVLHRRHQVCLFTQAVMSYVRV
jgi:hypothetical protein